MTQIKFNLLSNAEDSLRHAVWHLTSDEDKTAGDYKRALLGGCPRTAILSRQIDKN